MQPCGEGLKRCGRGTRCNKKTKRCHPSPPRAAAAAAAAAPARKQTRRKSPPQNDCFIAPPQEQPPSIMNPPAMPMKFRSCFSSICQSGYGISAVKSGLQKYLRRRENNKMKWCAAEIYKFKHGWTNETERKISRGIITNLCNRFIVMLDEELIFDETARYLVIREQLLPRIAAEETGAAEGIQLLMIVCDLLCDGRLLRLNSDINGYFGYRVIKENIDIGQYAAAVPAEYVGRAGDSANYIEAMRNFITWFLRKDTRCYYWLFHIYNLGEGHTTKRYRRGEAIYGVWEYLESLCARYERARKLFKYRIESFYEKEKKERRMFLISAVNMCMYMDEIDWSEEISLPTPQIPAILQQNRMELDDYCIDMHCAEGRRCGKDKSVFANEGSLVVDEYQKYKNQVWRDWYVADKMGVATTSVAAAAAAAPPSPPPAEAAAEPAPKKKIIIRRRIREPELEHIPLSEIQFERLCGNTTCGGKVMCFVAMYKGERYVFKEGRKSMGFNKDYALVDECKTAFGLHKIGMRRILSDHIVEKIDKTQKFWANNWQFRAAPNTVYTMMKYIEGGEKLIDVWRRREPTPAEIYDFMKIGLYRGIFGVSDFSATNIMVRADGNLISIDEHGMLGNRARIIGEHNGKIYRTNAHFLPQIWKELYEAQSAREIFLRQRMSKYDYSEEEIEAVLNRYRNLREIVDL